jgi:hypothetical protein
LTALITCPVCNGKSGHSSSGDGWDEWDECRCCNADGENESGLTTAEHVAKFRADEAAEAARIDALIEQDLRNKPEST